jgi:hypothetical protein
MNAKMKVLALALLGLAGYAGSAVAACPSSPVPPWNADSSPFQGTFAVVAGGLESGTPSECRLDSSINAGASGFASAQVHDDTPAAEPRYRAGFIINVDGLANPTITTTSSVFTASSSGSGLGVNLYVFSVGSGWLLSYSVADASNPSGFFSGSAPLVAGSNTIQFDLQVGASGSFTLWVNQPDEANPTLPAHTVDNSAVVGIDDAYLGLAAPSDQFVSTYAGMAAGFDHFDSRRQTFITF